MGDVSRQFATRREDFFVDSDPGIRVFVREVRDERTEESGVPVVLLHGARAASVASFDVDVPGGSVAAALAAAGHPAYLMDARGFGYSTYPPEMDEPPEANPPLVRSDEVVRDIAAVVAAVRARTGVERLALLGWATGSHWLGQYTAGYPEVVSHLILYNTLYGVAAPWPLGDDMEDPERPGQFDDSVGAYRFATADALLARWDASIPFEDKSRWRDPRVVDAYLRAALAPDPTSGERTPPSFRVPMGPLRDSFDLTRGRKLWDAAGIRVPTLVLAAERDFWSRPADREALMRELVNAPEARFVVIPGATHYAHLDRPECGRDQFLEAVLAFLSRR